MSNESKGKKEKAADRMAAFVGKNVLVETINTKEGLKYVVFNGTKTGDVKGYFKSESDGVWIAPPNDGLANLGVVLLPSEMGPLLDQDEIIEKIKSFIHKYVDCPEYWETYAAHYILMSWVFDRFSALHYFRILGDYDSGKSRFQKIIALVCNKAIRITGASTISPMFRSLHNYRGTVAVNEADVRDSSDTSDFIKFLNCGYEAGEFLIRSDKNGSGYTTKAFNIYGPKILTARNKYEDHAAESRIITYEPIKGRKIRDDIPRELPMEEVFKEAQFLRNCLLTWRFHNFESVIKDEKDLIELGNRNAQIGVCLYSIIKDEKFKKEFKEWLRHKGESAKQEGPNALIVNLLRSKVGQRIKLGDLVLDINEQLKQNADMELSSQKVAGILRSLGFTLSLARGINWINLKNDAQVLERVLQAYSVAEEE